MMSKSCAFAGKKYLTSLKNICKRRLHIIERPEALSTRGQQSRRSDILSFIYLFKLLFIYYSFFFGGSGGRRETTFFAAVFHMHYKKTQIKKLTAGMLTAPCL